MFKLKNKKNAQIPLNILILAILALLAIVSIAFAIEKNPDSFKNSGILDTFTSTSDDCNPEPITVKFTGTFRVDDGRKDTFSMSLYPEPVAGEVSDIRYNFETLSIFDTPFTWRVCPINPADGTIAGRCDDGTEKFDFTFKSAQFINKEVQFTVYSKIYDKNCNGVADEKFDIQFSGTVISEDDEKTVTTTDTYSFANGYLQD